MATGASGLRLLRVNDGLFRWNVRCLDGDQAQIDRFLSETAREEENIDSINQQLVTHILKLSLLLPIHVRLQAGIRGVIGRVVRGCRVDRRQRRKYLRNRSNTQRGQHLIEVPKQSKALFASTLYKLSENLLSGVTLRMTQLAGRFFQVLHLLLLAPPVLLLAKGLQFGLFPLQLRLPIHF